MDITEISHKDDIPWYEAPVPRRFHRCRAQTSAYEGLFTLIERCACGATRMNRRMWIGKNERRKMRKLKWR
jgi:hypothetical protein